MGKGREKWQGNGKLILKSLWICSWMSRNFLETAIFQIKERKQRQKFWKHGEIVILWGTHKSKEMLQAFLVHMF